MDSSVGFGEVPASSEKLVHLARDWWRDGDARLLPGEASGRTVFVVDFWDGCRYFGYTRGSVFARVAELVSEMPGLGSHPFAVQHACRVPYVVRCLASSLDARQARQLRNLLVLEAPAGSTGFNGTTVRAAGCCLVEEGSGGGLTFHEAAELGLFTPGTQDSRYECS